MRSSWRSDYSYRMRCKFSLFDRGRLENYEQSCAVDSVTKQCAGLPADCRMAMLGILGTDLRSNCACKGTDFTQLYDCMGWQRILWFNPCVGKYTSRLSYSLDLILVLPTRIKLLIADKFTWKKILYFLCVVNCQIFLAIYVISNHIWYCSGM